MEVYPAGIVRKAKSKSKAKSKDKSKDKSKSSWLAKTKASWLAKTKASWLAKANKVEWRRECHPGSSISRGTTVNSGPIR